MLTVAEVREHIETDLGDAALQRLLDDAYSEIEKRFGIAPTEEEPAVIELVTGRGASLFPSRPVAEVTSIDETVGDVVTTLAEDDYRLRYGGRVIERLSDGTNRRVRWGSLVTVEFVPATPTRDRVVVDLVKLAVQYEGVTRERVGDTSTDHLDYSKERERLLSILAPSAFGFA